MFHKVLAIVLTVMLLVTALPVAVLADAWFEVDADTAGSSSTVTVTVDGGALADILEEKGISTDLIRELWAQKAIDLSALKQVITTEEIFDVIPRDTLVELIKSEVDKIVKAVGFDAFESYIDTDAVMATADREALAARLPADADVDALLPADGAISLSALVEYLPISEVLATVDAKLLASQFDRQEILSLLKKIDLTTMVLPALATVYNKLMLNVDRITIRGYEVAVEDPYTKVLTFNAEALAKAIATVLLPSSLKVEHLNEGICVADISVTYTVDGTTTQKTKYIQLDLAVEGDLSRVANAMEKVESLIKAYINELSFANGKLTLDVTVPGVAAKLFAAALDSESIPEELKQKILNLANMDGVAIVDAITLDDLITLFDVIEPSALFEAFKNISYVQTALSVVASKTGYDLADLTLDDLVDYATRVPSFERISEIIANKTGVNVLSYINTLAIKADPIIDRVEKISAVQKILDKVSAKFGINLSDISATEIVDRAKDAPISETIAKVIKSKLGVDILAVLDTYTVDELYEKALEKASDYEAQYNKVRNYVKYLASYLPDELTTGMIADAYDGDGVFSVDGNASINAKAFVEKLLRKITSRINIPEKAINFILSNVRGSNLDLALDLTVRTTDIYRITYMNREGTEVLYSVFLPVGADLSIFKNNSEISGYEFTGWTDENGVEILTMPAADTVVYADRNAIHVYFKDVDGTVLGMIPMMSGDTLADHADKLAEIVALVKIPTFNAHIMDGYSIAWFDAALDAMLADDTKITNDTTLTATLTPKYHFTFDIDVPYEVTEENGDYTLSILGDLPESFKLNLANNVFLLRASGADDVSLEVVIENGGYTFLTLEDATLAQIYDAQGGEVVFDYAKAAAATESFQNTAYAGAADTAFYSFDIFSNGAKVTEAFAAPIRIQVPFTAAIENAAGSATRVHTVANGARELITSTGVVAEDGVKYVWFEAPHFSDYVIANEYLVTVNFTDGNNAINGTMVGVDSADMYFPVGEKLILNFTVDAGYSIDKIEALVAGTTTEYDLLDEFVMPENAVTFTVTATTGAFKIFYYVNGKLAVDAAGDPIVTLYTKADVAGFTTADAFLKPFATVTAGATVPAGYQNTGSWVGFDKNLLGVTDMYVSAKWNPITYTVEFKDAASFQVTVENYAYVVVEPAVPEKAGEYGAWEAYDLSKLAEKANASNVYTINATYQKLVYSVIVDGNVTAAPSTATAGEEITLTVTQKFGYEALLSVKTDKGEDVAVADGKFTMPAANVYVTVTYNARPMSYTVNGVAGTGFFGDNITFEVKLPAGYVLIQAPNASLVSTATVGDERVLTYTFCLTENDMAIVYDIQQASALLFKIFNGSLFTGSGDPVSTDKNVTFDGWSSAVAGIFSFATFSAVQTQSLLWLWILIAVLVLIAIIAILYALYINGKIRRPLFLLRFVAWLVGLFFALCLAVSGLFLKVAKLFGKSDDPEDYGFDEVDVEDEAPVEEPAEEAAEETEAATEEPAEATDADAAGDAAEPTETDGETPADGEPKAE